MKEVLIAVIDDDPEQAEMIKRKVVAPVKHHANIESILIHTFYSLEDFMRSTMKFDFHIVDYELTPGGDWKQNGIYLIHQANLIGNAILFTGNVRAIPNTELELLFDRKCRLVEKPNCQEVIKSAVDYFLSKAV